MEVRKLFATAAVMGGGLALGVTVAGFYGGFWWGFDLVANFRWQAMWIAFVAAIVYALNARGALTVLFVGAAVVNAWLIGPAWFGSQPEPTGEDAIRVVHIDLSGGADGIAPVSRWLVQSNADLVLVAGVSTDQVASVVVENSPYTLLSKPNAQPGVAVLGRDRWTLKTSLSPDGQSVHVVTVPAGVGLIDVVTSWGTMGTSRRSAEAVAQRFDEVTKAVNEAPNPVVVIGNMGASKWAQPSRHLLRNTTLRDATEGAGYLPTSPFSDLPIIGAWIGIPLDVVYVEPDLTPLDIAVGPDVGADHLPVTIVVGPTK